MKNIFCRKSMGFLFLMCLLCPVANAQKIPGKYSHLFTTPKNYIVTKTEETIRINGKADESAWENASWSTLFEDIEGTVKPKPTYDTRVKMLWDQTNLYIYAELEEPHISASLTEHDQIVWHDNDFEVFLDPDGNANEYFEFEVNALNTVLDLYMCRPYRNGGEALLPYNFEGMQVALDINGTVNDPSDTDKKWSVEMAIPFKSVSIGNNVKVPQNNTIWRMNFSRVEWTYDVEDHSYSKTNDPENNWVWSPQGIINMHAPERWGYLQFSTQTTAEDLSFTYPENKPLKDYLWLIYYMQRDFHGQNGYYAKDLKTLSEDLETIPCADCIRGLEATHQQFLAIIQSEALQETWMINEQGQISSSTLKNKRKLFK